MTTFLPKKSNLKTRGITLIETLISVSLLSVLVFGILNIYLAYGKLFAQNTTQFNTVNDNRTALRSLESNILQAHRVVASHTFGDGTTYTTAADTLVLQLPTVDLSNNVIANTWDYIAVYRTDANHVYRLLEAAPPSARVSGTKLLSTTAQTIAFTFDNDNLDSTKIVAVQITARDTSGHVTAQNQITNQVRLRNY